MSIEAEASMKVLKAIHRPSFTLQFHALLLRRVVETSTYVKPYALAAEYETNLAYEDNVSTQTELPFPRQVTSPFLCKALKSDGRPKGRHNRPQGITILILKRSAECFRISVEALGEPRKDPGIDELHRQYTIHVVM